MNNPIIAKIRKIRNEHARQFNYDVSLIVDDYQKRSGQIREKFGIIKNVGDKIMISKK